MSDTTTNEIEESRPKRHTTAQARDLRLHPESLSGESVSPFLSPTSLSHPEIGRQANAPLRSRTMHDMQRTHGNRAVQRHTGGPGHVAIQRTPDWASIFDETNYYDQPTPEEMEILEEMYRKGLQADDAIPPTQPSPAPAVTPPASPNPQVPVVEPAPVSDSVPTLRQPPTTAPAVEPPGPVTVRSPGVQPPPPVVEPTAPPTLRSPGVQPPAVEPTAPTAGPATAAPSLGSQLLRYGGGALGVIGGALGLYSGGKEAWNAGGDGGQLSDIGDILHGGLTIGAGGASMAGGVATLMGGTAASAGALGGAVMLGKAGAVLGAGLLGYAGGRLLDQGSDWVGKQVSETGVGEALGMNRGGDYGISALMGKGAFAVDKAIGSLWGDESKEYNPETDDPTKVDRSYENTLAWKINQWLD